MTVKELKEKLLNIPNDVEVFLECDHGQNKESASCMVVSRSPIEEEHYAPDEMIFEWDNWKECYDEDCVDEYDEKGKITAVLISY